MSTKMKRLYRSENDRMIGGVCAGLSEYLGIDATIIRLLFVFATIWGGAGALVYLIMLLVVPEDPMADDGLFARVSAVLADLGDSLQ